MLGWVIKRNKIKGNRLKSQIFRKNLNFVHGTSSEEEKEIRFSRQTNEEFSAQIKKQQQAKDVSKKTCFKCQQIGHVGHKCPNLKSVDVDKKKRQSEAVKQKITKFESKRT
ncbi:putative transcription factor interactor and regulator CCHC(Zn) family [Helianthus anomalus]